MAVIKVLVHTKKHDNNPAALHAAPSSRPCSLWGRTGVPKLSTYRFVIKKLEACEVLSTSRSPRHLCAREAL